MAKTTHASKAGTFESDYECKNCWAPLTMEDILDFGQSCPNCFEALDLEDYPSLEKDLEEYTESWDQQVIDNDDVLDSYAQRICCGEEKAACECHSDEQGPTFDEALNEYLSDLPKEIYIQAFPAPCLDCTLQWSGMCKPLVAALYMCHLSATNKDGNYYLGSIDGCLDYVKQTTEDTNVKHVRIVRAADRND